MRLRVYERSDSSPSWFQRVLSSFCFPLPIASFFVSRPCDLKVYVSSCSREGLVGFDQGSGGNSGNKMRPHPERVSFQFIPVLLE